MKTGNQTGSIAMVLIVLVAVGAVGFAGYTVMKKSDAKDNNGSSSQSTNTSSPDTKDGEAKAQAYINAIKNSSNSMSKEFISFGKELDSYALAVEKPNLSRQERLQESTKMGASIGVYSSKLKNGTVTNQGSKSISQNPQAIETTFKVQGNDGKSFEIVITTAYLDNDWRLTNIEIA